MKVIPVSIGAILLTVALNSACTARRYAPCSCFRIDTLTLEESTSFGTLAIQIRLRHGGRGAGTVSVQRGNHSKLVYPIPDDGVADKWIAELLHSSAFSLARQQKDSDPDPFSEYRTARICAFGPTRNLVVSRDQSIHGGWEPVFGSAIDRFADVLLDVESKAKPFKNKY